MKQITWKWHKNTLNTSAFWSVFWNLDKTRGNTSIPGDIFLNRNIFILYQTVIAEETVSWIERKRFWTKQWKNQRLKILQQSIIMRGTVCIISSGKMFSKFCCSFWCQSELSFHMSIHITLLSSSCKIYWTHI